ncbi:response regulator [Kineococcus sp. TBRC 1896]|uniref:Response regulator n=1 Tax=Kineococcus mangrovi TaxID=1660183 RepID=A0ABV4I3F4_9ACTN
MGPDVGGPGSERPLRVVVVDDEALVRSGLTMILQAGGDVRVVGACSGEDAVALVARERPDVVLLDVRMPLVDGVTVLEEVLRAPSPPAVAMLTTFEGDQQVARALRAGASGFLLKDTDPLGLVQAVRSLAAGGVVLSPRAARTLLAEHAEAAGVGPPTSRALASLTAREHDVLALLAQGMSNAAIGAELDLGVGTVKDHVSSILGKLAVRSRVQAALLARRVPPAG